MSFGDEFRDNRKNEMTSEMTSRKKHRNSRLMTCHFADLGSASDWSCRKGNLSQPVMTRHQYGISAPVSQTSFSGETSGSIAKCQPFSQANLSQK